MNSFYNTTHLKGSELNKSEKKAYTQEIAILQIFQENPDKAFSPYQVWQILKGVWPITSIRRAMTNLTKKGLLRKTVLQVIGMYGKPNYCWEVAA